MRSSCGEEIRKLQQSGLKQGLKLYLEEKTTVSGKKMRIIRALREERDVAAATQIEVVHASERKMGDMRCIGKALRFRGNE